MSEQTKTLAEALLAAQREMPAVDRDGTNPHFKSKFTTLDNLLSKVRPVLNRHDLVLVQAPDLKDGQFVLKTTLLHSPSDESVSFAAPLAPPKNDPQGQGSAITYMRRYALAAALAIADQEDDDGNAATKAEEPQAQRSDGASGNGKKGFLSAKQRNLFEKLLRDAGFNDDGIAEVADWANSTMSGGRDQGISKAIDGLKDTSTRTEFADRLGKAAKKFAADLNTETPEYEPTDADREVSF